MATLPPLAWIIASVVCSSTAHLLLKLGAMRIVTRDTLTGWALQLASNGWLVAGAALHVAALGLWVIGLQRVMLSLAYPFIALGFVLVSILSWMFLSEPLTVRSVAGMALIIAGVLVLGRG